MGMILYGVPEASCRHGNAEIHMHTNFNFMVCKFVLMVIKKYTCLTSFISLCYCLQVLKVVIECSLFLVIVIMETHRHSKFCLSLQV